MSRRDGSTVLLSDTDEALHLATHLATQSLPADCYRSVGELVKDRCLESVSVLVLLFRPLPAGVLLATLGRMNLEYPQIQKVVVLDAPPPLPIAQYLASCSVDLVPCRPGDEKGADQLASVVQDLKERAAWLTSWAPGDLSPTPRIEEIPQ